MLEFLEVQEEYIKDEQRNLKKEYLHAQEEVKRIQSVPLVIGQFLGKKSSNRKIFYTMSCKNFQRLLIKTLALWVQPLVPTITCAFYRQLTENC